jgi:hypothetical protein
VSEEREGGRAREREKVRREREREKVTRESARERESAKRERKGSREASTKGIYRHGKIDLSTWQKRPISLVHNGKRALSTRQKHGKLETKAAPAPCPHTAKETYLNGKRALSTWQKRPI